MLVRQAGGLQGIVLILPITMAVVGVSLFTATAALMAEHFKNVKHAEYLVQLLITMPAIWTFLFSPVAGWLTDICGRRRVLLAAMTGYGLVGAAPYWLENIYFILVTRCGVGICESVVITASTTMISDYFKGRTRERWIAAQLGLSALSGFFVVWGGGRLGAELGWHGPFLMYLYSFILVAGVWAATWEPQKNSPVESGSTAEVIYTSFPMARMIAICAVTLVAAVMFFATVTRSTSALVSLGVQDPAVIGRLSSLANLGLVVGTTLYWAVSRLHVASLLFIDFFLMGNGFLWMGVALTPSQYAWAAGLQQVGCGMVLSTLLVWATRGLAFGIRGRAMGMWQAAFAIGQFVSGVTLLLLDRQLGGLASAFTALGKVCMALAGTAFIVKWVSTAERRVLGRRRVGPATSHRSHQ